MITPDLKQNTIVTVYLLFTHNYLVFAYFLGLIVSIFIAMIRPSRFIIFMLLGFAILVLSFEYDKHLIVPFREQTLRSLITTTPHYRLQKLINLVVSEIIPMLLYLLGWLFIYGAMIVGALKKEKKE